MANIETNDKSSDSSNSVNNNNQNILNSDQNLNKNSDKKSNKFLEIAFISCVSGTSILFGFSSALAMAKKKDTNAFDKGLSVTKGIAMQSGGSLAMRALLWGSLYACTGFGLFCFTVWKAMRVNDLKEFRQKVGNFLPKLTNKSTNSRTEFSSVRDLLEYIIEESDKSKNQNNKNGDKK